MAAGGRCKVTRFIRIFLFFLFDSQHCVKMETTVFSKHQSENSIQPIEGHQTHMYWCETLKSLCQYLLIND